MTPPSTTRRNPLRLLPLWLWLVCVVACVWQITRTNFVADLSAFLPAHPDAQQRVLIEQLESGLPARTLLIGIRGADAKARAEASRRLAARLRAGGLFEQVQNGETVGYERVGTLLFEHRYQLSPAVGPERFTAEGLREGLDETLSLLGTPAGAMVKPILERDPTGETVRIAEGLIPSSAPRSVEGVWASRSTGADERALLLAISRAPGADLDAQQRAIDAVREGFAAVQSALNAPQLELQLTGAPLFGVDSRAQIEREVKWLSIAGTVVMLVLLWLAFASMRALAVAALPVATGVLAGIAAVSLLFGNVHGMTLGFGTTLIGEAVDYAIYFLIQARAAGAAGWVRHGWPTIRLGVITSICGFVALLFSGFPGLQQLGVFSVSGLLGAALFTRFVMPLLAPEGSPGLGWRRQLGQATAAAIAWLPRLKRPLLALGLGALVLMAWRAHGGGSIWQAQLSSLSPLKAEALALDASLRADLSAGDARTLVVVSGPDLQATLARAEAAGRALDTLVDQGRIAGYDSVTRWLPTDATQRARQAALPPADALRERLQDATEGLPLTAERLAPFVDEVQAARDKPLLTLAALREAGLASLLDALLLQRKDGSWVALLPLQPPVSGAMPPAETLRPALAAVDSVQVLEIGPELTRLYERYLGQAQGQSLLGALGVLALVAVSLRAPRRVLAVAQPLVLAVVLTMGLLVAFGVPLGILHLVGLLLVVAVGSNYALFFDMLQHGPADGGAAGADLDTLASLLLANITTVLSFLLIALSEIPALAAVGTVVAIGATLALLLAAAFARAR